MTNSIQKELQVFIGEIVNQFNPERIILFGSHAYGNAKPDSDIDLLVVMDFEGRPHQKAFEMRRKIKRSFPLDLLVRRPGDIADRIRKGDFFIKEIIHKGKVLYERSYKGMD